MTGRRAPPKTPRVQKTGPDVCVILCTCPEAVATPLATVVVEEQLAACVNIIPRVRSIYRWDGAVHDDAESLLVIKTSRDGIEALRSRLIEQHPYEVPEVLVLPVSGGSEPYVQWILNAVGPAEE